ncbi:MAG: GNAT family N-acetyltransferase [Pseudomonadota bacterium]
MQIRSALATDATAISHLIKGVTHYFTLDQQGHGAEAFLKGIEPAAILGYINALNIDYFVGKVDDQLAGVVALRDQTHLYHLFVAPDFQNRGYSRQLWQYASEAAILAGNQTGFTVNSTPYAVPVYEKFGFRASGPRLETNGIAFVPMRREPDGISSNCTINTHQQSVKEIEQ